MHADRDRLHAAKSVADDNGDHERHCRPKGECDEDKCGDSSHRAVIGIELRKLELQQFSRHQSGSDGPGALTERGRDLRMERILEGDDDEVLRREDVRVRAGNRDPPRARQDATGA